MGSISRIGHFGAVVVVSLSKELYSPHYSSHPAVKPSWTCVYSPASPVMTPVTLLGRAAGALRVPRWRGLP